MLRIALLTLGEFEVMKALSRRGASRCDKHQFRANLFELSLFGSSLAEPDSHTKSGRESGISRILSWC